MHSKNVFIVSQVQTALPILESHVKSILSFQDLHLHAMITLSFYHDLFIARITVLSEL